MRMAGLARSAAIVVCLAAGLPAVARPTIFVDASQSPGGNGTSWNQAYRDLQDALTFATNNTEIWVADGTYTPDRGTNQRAAVFAIPSGARLYGGFAGGESSLSLRNPTANQTVLSGDLGVLGDNTDNSIHILRLSAGSFATRLDGFMIVDGNASGAAYPDDSGGGVLADGVSPIIESCYFLRNSAKFGGGLFGKNGTIEVRGCEFQSNFGSQDGGGAVARGGGSFKNCIFDANTAVFGGGIMACCGSIRIDTCTFRANFANKGGGIYTAIGSMIVTKCGLFSNSAIEGGGLYSSAPGTVIFNSRFGSNTAQLGGGIHTASAASMTNCVIGRNFGSMSGGGVYSTQSTVMTNCTLFANVALQFGGGLYSLGGNPVVRNTILWENSDSGGLSQNGQFYRVTGTPAISYCCVQNWNGSLGGVGIKLSSPRFVDPDGVDNIPGTEDDNYSIFDGSPCIDAGDNTGVPQDAADLDADSNLTEPVPVDIGGGERFIEDLLTPNNGVGAAPLTDIGADEFNPGACVGDANGDQLVNGADISVILGQFGDSVNAGTGADYNIDGLVDNADLSVLLSAFGSSC